MEILHMTPDGTEIHIQLILPLHIGFQSLAAQ